MKKITALTVLFCLFVVFGPAAAGFAQPFPSKSIRMIIPYAAGGGTDVLARALQRPLEKELGAKVVVENIPAGTTKVGTMEMMKAKPDGYTIELMADIAWAGYFYSGTYDTKIWQKATPIANVTIEPYFFYETRAEAPYSTWAEFVAYAKKNPNKIFSCGAPGAGGALEVVTMDIMKAHGIRCQYVPFQGAGPSKIALLGGHIDLRVCQITEAITMIQAGKTKGLAISSSKRLKEVPNVPTFKELGIGDTQYLTRAVWGPPKMPENIVNILSKAIERAGKDPEFVKLVEDKLLYKIEYRPPKSTFEQVENFDRRLGAKLAESYKK